MYSGLSSTTIKLKILYGHHVTSHFIKIVTPINIFLHFQDYHDKNFQGPH